jgi:hypothetical protein
MGEAHRQAGADATVMRPLAMLLASALNACACSGAAKPPEPVKPPNDAATTTTKSTPAGKPMPLSPELLAIRNDNIKFITSRPPGATLPTRGRQVEIIGPSEALAIVKRGDIAVLDELLPMLEDRDRIWAAEVMLAALTGEDTDLVNDFARAPQEFIDNFAEAAPDRWKRWLAEYRPRLSWDPARNQFRIKSDGSSSTKPDVKAIRNDNIEYATYTPPEGRGKAPPSLYRQVSVTAPPEAFALSRSGDIATLDVLVPLLDDPDRNWAALVMLSALTGHRAPDVIAFEKAENFKGTVGEHDARKHWETWLAEHRAKLQWDAERHQFRVK